jgi:hypothetical protein
MCSVIKKLFGERGLEIFRSIKRRLFAAKDFAPNVPKIIVAYKHFNIVAYQSFFYGIPHSLGKVDFFNSEQLDNPLIIRAESLKKVKERINLKPPE